jgi:hypothetical protein
MREDQLLERLRRYEALLKLHGLSLEDSTGKELSNDKSVPEESRSSESASAADDGKLIVGDGHSQYIEKYVSFVVLLPNTVSANVSIVIYGLIWAMM